MAGRGRGLIQAFIVALLVASSFQFAQPAQARTITVCSVFCDFTTIADALKQASDGDSISILPGAYAGGFTIEKNVDLRGAGRDTTTILGTSAASVVRIGTRANVLIRGVTISGGGGSQTRSNGRGGGGILNEGELTLTDSIVRDNAVANGLGGGIYSNATKPLRIFDSVIAGNQADNGGGIYIREGDVFVTNTTVSSNQSGADGGGIRHEGGETVRIEKSVIRDNVAGRTGGGVFVRAALQVLDSTVSGNRARFGGGLAGGSKTLNAINTEIRDNDVGDGLGGGILVGDGGVSLRDAKVTGNLSGSGAGIHSVAGDIRLTSSTVLDNAAEDDGGGIFNRSAKITLFSSEVVANRAGERGGGVFVGRGGSLKFGDSGNTISGNQPDQCFGATC